MIAEPVPPIEVLLVDDSAVVRHLVAGALASATDVVVRATAANGEAALEQLATHVPDVVVLDVEMPVLDGLATLERIRARWVDLPVIMFSTLTTRGASATLDALARGATDYVSKPSNAGGPEEARDLVLRDLLPVVRSCGAAGSRRRPGARPPGPTRPSAGAPTPPRPRTGLPPSRWGHLEALVVASSTGGPHALTEIVPRLPAELGVPVLVVQHMPTLFTRLLAERLDARSALRVREGADGVRVEAGTVYVAPGGEHMEVRRAPDGGAVLARNDGPPENSCKPSADVLFRSAASLWGRRALGLVLTGMGHDGLEGCRALRAVGAPVYVQDEATSVVWGMPGAVARAGLATAELPLDGIADALAGALRPPLRAGLVGR